MYQNFHQEVDNFLPKGTELNKNMKRVIIALENITSLSNDGDQLIKDIDTGTEDLSNAIIALLRSEKPELFKAPDKKVSKK